MKAVKFQIKATKTRVLMVDTCFGSVRELTLVGILRGPPFRPLYSTICGVLGLLVVDVVCMCAKISRSLS